MEIQIPSHNLVGLSFDSPSVYRRVEILRYNDKLDAWEVRNVGTGKSSDGLETGTLLGRVTVGDFELDQEVIRRLSFVIDDLKREDFTPEEIALMESTGNIQEAYSMFCYVDRPSMTNYEIWHEPGEYDSWDYYRHSDWDGARSVRWSMWRIKPDDRVTVVGIQKGNKITYCDNLDGGVSRSRSMSEDEIKEEKSSPFLQIAIGLVIALACAYMGVRSMKKKDE